MKCLLCGSEWEQNSSTNSDDFCPCCKAPISLDHYSVETAMQWIVKAKGIEVFQNPGIINAILADLVTDDEKGRYRIKMALSAGAGNDFYNIVKNNGFSDNSRYQFIYSLGQYEFSEDFCSYVANVFAYAFNSEKRQEVIQNTPSPKKQRKIHAVVSSPKSEASVLAQSRDISSLDDMFESVEYQQLLEKQKEIEYERPILDFFGVTYERSMHEKIKKAKAGAGYYPRYVKPLDWSVEVIELGENSSSHHKSTNLLSNQEYQVNISYMNNGDLTGNPYWRSIAYDVGIAVSIPSKIESESLLKISCFCGNTHPAEQLLVFELHSCEYSDSKVLKPLKVSIIPNSLLFHNQGKLDGSKLSNNLFHEGLFLGHDEFDGKIPVGSVGAGSVSFRFKTSSEEF